MFEKKKRRGVGPVVVITMGVVIRVTMNVDGMTNIDGNDQGLVTGQQ